MSRYGKGMVPPHPMPSEVGTCRIDQGLAASFLHASTSAPTSIYIASSTSSPDSIQLGCPPPSSTKPTNNLFSVAPHDPSLTYIPSASSFIQELPSLSSLDENINTVSTFPYPFSPASPTNLQAPAVSTTSVPSLSSIPLKPTAVLRFLFQNVNGLNPDLNNPKLDSVHEFVVGSNADVFCMSETNVAWHWLPSTQRLHARTSEWFEARHLSVAWNLQEDPVSPSQYGGTAILSLNQMAYHVAASRSDDTGLGRWAWTRFWGKQGAFIHVISCYRPVHNDKGPRSVYNQHRRFFLQSRNHTCPRQQFLLDLKKCITQWQEDGDIIVIGGDWNEDTNAGPWKQFWQTLGLVPVASLSGRHPTATHTRGSNQIDNVYVSPLLAQVSAGFLSPSLGVLGADHSAIWLDIPAELLSFTLTSPQAFKARRLKTTHPKIRDAYTL